MVRRNGAEVRKERIQKIGRRALALLHENDGRIPLGKTVSALAYEFGLTKEKIMEYLSILEDLDRFVLDIEKDEILSIISEETLDD